MIARIGNHFSSKVSESTLQAEELPKLITGYWAKFVALTIRTDTWKTNRAALPLFKTARSVRGLLNGFGDMWELHYPGEQAERIDIPDT